MDLSVLIQSCDHYEKYWPGLFYYMDKFWDKKINHPIYFCNEKKSIKEYDQIKTGVGSFVSNLKFSLNKIKSKYIFYLLEDFWPICCFKKKLLDEISLYILDNNIKCFQISSYLPYYDLDSTKDFIQNQKIFKFNKHSKWRFNFQCRIWEKEFLLNSLHEPDISEKVINSAISVEEKCDNLFDKNIDVYFYHCLWYPISGVSYRGEFTTLGLELENNMKIDLYGKYYSSSHSLDESSSSSSSSSIHSSSS